MPHPFLRPSSPPALSAVVVFQNDCDRLEDCLASLRGWVDELICVNLDSSDGSLILAQQQADRMLHAPASTGRILALAATIRRASHDWVLVVEPEERVPASLAQRLLEALATHPRAAGFQVPRLRAFGRRPLPETTWSNPLTAQRLMHRQRQEFLPAPHTLCRPLAGQAVVSLPAETSAALLHLGSPSYRRLMAEAWHQGGHAVAAGRSAAGERFEFFGSLRRLGRELVTCMMRGGREGFFALTLGLIQTGHVLAGDLLTLLYQLSGRATETQEPPLLPPLVEDTPSHAARQRAAAAAPAWRQAA